jgi:hypothetical protein
VQRLVEYCARQTQTSRLLRRVGERQRMGG